MADAPGSAVKVCASCSKDVSKLPRTKDAKGRYLCQECLARLKQQPAVKPSAAKPAATAAAAPAEADVLGRLLADTPGVELCPNCGGGMQVNSRICIRCGFNKETGKATKIVVEKAPKDRESPSRSVPKLAFTPGTYLVLLICLVGGGFGAAMYDPGYAVVLYGVAGLVLTVAYIWAIVAAFQDEDTTYAALGLVGIVVPFVGLAMFYYGLIKTTRDYLKMTYWAAFLGMVLAIVALLGAIPSADEVEDDQPARPPVSAPETPAQPSNGDNLLGG